VMSGDSIEKTIRQVELLCHSSRAKPKLSLCIGQRPMLWLFRSYRGLFFILLTAKVYEKPVLKIFALAVYGDAFFCSRQIFVRRPFQSGKDFAFKSFYFSLAQNSSSQLSSKGSGCIS